MTADLDAIERSSTRNLLERALTRIEDETHWCQDDLALDADGRPVPPVSDAAVKWCAFGALIAEGDAADSRVAAGTAALIAFERATGSNIATVNDSDGHAAVIDGYRKAIDSLGKTS